MRLLTLFPGAALLLAVACGPPDRAAEAGGNAGETVRRAAAPGKALPADPAGDFPLPVAETVCTGLEVPWGLALLPDGRLLVTERGGRLSRVDPGTGRRETLAERSPRARGEGGLLGLAVGPDFAGTGHVFLYETAESGNRIVRLTLDGDAVTGERVLLDGIPAARFHDGGALAFGPDGHLYVGTGDARDPESAADPGSLAGKILRLTAGGAAAPGNPFAGGGGDPRVYSLGHRNVQGLAWDAEGRLWATEHGPSGEINGWCCHDELNRVVAGGDYGWPRVIGDAGAPGVRTPAAHSGRDTWAPAGLAVLGEAWRGYAGSLVMGGLRGEQLRRFALPGEGTGRQEAWFAGRFGRLRAVLAAPDGTLYVTTSNRDGRGRPREGDDRILAIRPGAAP